MKKTYPRRGAGGRPKGLQFCRAGFAGRGTPSALSTERHLSLSVPDPRRSLGSASYFSRRACAVAAVARSSYRSAIASTFSHTGRASLRFPAASSAEASWKVAP